MKKNKDDFMSRPMSLLKRPHFFTFGFPVWGAVCLSAMFVAAVPVKAGAVDQVDSLRSQLAAFPAANHSRKKAVLFSDLGTILYKQGKFENASMELENALRLGRPTKALKRHIYLFLGKSYESSGRFSEAIEAYKKARDYDPKNWKRSRDLALLQEQLLQPEDAYDSIQVAIKRNPKEPSLYLAQGRLCRKIGYYEEAEESLLKFQSTVRFDMDMFREMSLVYEGMGRYKESLMTFEKTLVTGAKPEDWARFIYLAVLSRNKAFANQGMERLRNESLPEGSLGMYETIDGLIGVNFQEILNELPADIGLKELVAMATREGKRE